MLVVERFTGGPKCVLLVKPTWQLGNNAEFASEKASKIQTSASLLPRFPIGTESMHTAIFRCFGVHPLVPCITFKVMISMREDDIPTFRVDLARPPELRYHEVAVAFGTRMRSMSAVFDELLQSMLGYRFLAKVAKFAAQLFLRRLYDDEQTKEVKAIARVARVDLYLLIALNVFLDILMGCTAGCVKARPTPSRGSTTGERPRLMHFRTLDWGMDALRDLLVVLEYVDSSTGSDRVIATTITYAGFVGTLTGVRYVNWGPNTQAVVNADE